MAQRVCRGDIEFDLWEPFSMTRAPMDNTQSWRSLVVNDLQTKQLEPGIRLTNVGEALPVP